VPVASAERPVADTLAAYASDALPSPRWWRALAPRLAGLYGAAVAARNALYDRGALRVRRLPGRVISVGNLAAGGTGKSPVVMELARLLVRLGHRPAILTRGYGTSLARCDALALLGGREIMAPSTPAPWPDEARMQSEALPEVPIIVGRDRYAAARRFLALPPGISPLGAPTHWLLDDGFQHRRLARDLDIVLLDAARPLGGHRLLPHGLLREPPAALARAGLVIYTRCAPGLPTVADERAVAALASAQALRAVFRPGPLTPVAGAPASVPGPVLLAAGVATPEQVHAALVSLRVAVAATYFVRDHAAFAPAELVRRLGAARAVVTTAKDYWRDPDVFTALPVPTYLLGMSLDWDEAAIRAALLGVQGT
jgi:tetraacyldisaccharide 4'-kinase